MVAHKLRPPMIIVKSRALAAHMRNGDRSQVAEDRRSLAAERAGIVAEAHTLSVTSRSDIRYEGTLTALDEDTATIRLSNVRSFGTEGRRRGDDEIPPAPPDAVFDYITFRGRDIQDLKVITGRIPPAAAAAAAPDPTPAAAAPDPTPAAAAPS